MASGYEEGFDIANSKIVYVHVNIASCRVDEAECR